MSIYSHLWRILQILLATIVTVVTQELDSQEMLDNPDSVPPFPVFLPVGFQVRDADSVLFLKEAGQDIMRNSSMRSGTQALLVGRAAGAPRLPILNVTYGPLGVQRMITPDLLGLPVPLFRPSPDASAAGWRVRWHVLSRHVTSLAPSVRVLFYVAGRTWDRGEREPGGAADQLPCVTVFAFWQTQEVRASCLLGARRGTCLVALEPPAGWFSPVVGSSSRERLSMEAPSARGNTVELYYQARPSEEGRCQDAGGKGGAAGGGGGGRGARERVQLRAEYTPVTPMTRIGSVRLLQETQGAAPVTQLRLGDAIFIQTSSKPLKQTDIATFYVLIRSTSLLDTFTLRASLKKGVSFRTATPSNTLLWDTTMDTSADGTIAVICQQRSSGKRPNSKLLEILQMDFEVEELSTQAESQVIAWQLVLPSDARATGQMEGTMRIYTTQRDFIGLAPLVLDTEIINTAILTGKRVAVPVRTVAVEANGSVTDVSDFTDCSSTDEDVLKVSDRCDYVYVNGKEQRGRVRMTVNFTYSYLSTQLEMSVWVPRLPLQIELSDNELSQIKGWRIPIQATKRLGWSSDEEDRKGKGCMLQFQHALVRVVTHFVAEQSEARGSGPREPLAIFLGSDWQVDVTKLVRYFLKVEDPRIARLQAGRVLSGKDVGTTKIQVFSPLSDSILAERTVRVLEERVSIMELGLQLVSGLSLSLQLSPGSDRAVLATATTQEELSNPKQEAVLSSWLQFSDGSLTPLDFYDPMHYRLSVTSLDEGVVSVQGEPPAVSVVAEGEGQGALVRVEMGICEACHKSKRKTVLAVGLGSLKVKFQVGGRRAGSGGGNRTGAEEGGGTGPGGGTTGKDGGSDYGNDGEEVAEGKQPGSALPGTGTEQDVASSSVSEREESAMRKLSTTTKPTVRDSRGSGGSPGGANSSDDLGKGPGNLVNYNNFPAQVEVPKSVETEANDNSGAAKNGEDGDGDDEEVGAGSLDNPLGLRPLTDLEIGMYALLGVFCLAILVFLVNCMSYLVKFRHKQLPAQGGSEPAGHHHHHRHDWVWLGTDAELVMSAPGSPMQHEQHLLHQHHHAHAQQATTVIDIDRTGSLAHRGHCPALGSPAVATGNTVAAVTGGVMVGGCQGGTLVRGGGGGGGGEGPAGLARGEAVHSPTSKRKRVQFTTFGSLDRHSPHLPPRVNGNGGIHWVGKESSDCCDGGGGDDDGESETQVPDSDSLEQL
ncbi:transmembrane protein 132D [Alosa alosa]|nr:transmembrane protein 132D [Alosa alosa]